MSDFENASGDIVHNAPMPYAPKGMPSNFHGAHGNRKSPFEVRVNSDWERKLARMGLRFRSNFGQGPVEGAVFNDVSRSPTPNEEEQGVEEVFYAKFVEYGYTPFWNPDTYVPGHRLYEQVRPQLVSLVKRNIMAVAREKGIRALSRKDVVEAINRSLQQATEIFASVTPISDSKWRTQQSDPHMKDMWKYIPAE